MADGGYWYFERRMEHGIEPAPARFAKVRRSQWAMNGVDRPPLASNSGATLAGQQTHGEKFF